MGQVPVHGDVDLPDLRELEILVEVVHGLQASRGQRRLVPAQGRLVVRIQREGGNGVRAARHVDAAQLHRLPPRVAIGVGQPYVGRPAREQADAAAQHGPAVSRDVIVEAHTRRPQQVSGRHVLRVHAEGALRVGVGARLVREGRNVEAQAVGQVQPRRRVPLVLDVEPELADPEIGDRRGRPGIRQRARERGRAPGLEGRKACERPQPRELPDEQVLEVEELVVRSQRELVPSLEPEGDVVGELVDVLVEAVRLGELLGAGDQGAGEATGGVGRGRRVARDRHLHLRERHVGVPLVADGLAPKDHLVKQSAAKSRVQLKHAGVRHVPDHIVVGRERVVIAARGRHVARLDVVVTEGEHVVLPHLPVEPAEQVGVGVVERHLPEVTGVKGAVVRPENVGEPRGRVRVDPRRGYRVDADVGTGVRPAASLALTRHEDVELVAEERRPDRAAVLVFGEFPEGLCGQSAANQVVVLVILEEGAVNLVRAAPCDRVDQAAREPALADVERGDEHLVLGDGIDRDRLRPHLAAWLPGAPEPEQVVVHRPVDLDVVEAVVLSRGGSARDLRRGLDEVSKVAGQGR